MSSLEEATTKRELVTSPCCCCCLQESCARVLLFRGADRSTQNYANQDAFQVAVISGNRELADVIKNFNEEEVGELR